MLHWQHAGYESPDRKVQPLQAAGPGYLHAVLMLNDFVSVQAPTMRKKRRLEHWNQWNEHPSAGRSTKPVRYGEKKFIPVLPCLDLTFDNHSIN